MSPVKKLFAAIKLVRFEHAIMFALSVLIAEIMAAKGMLTLTPAIIFSLFVPVFSEMGAFAMNDLLDIETDRLNRKKGRPLVTGELSEKFALIVTVISFILALVFAAFISPFIFLFTLAINLLAIAYNVLLKDLPLVGNVYIAFTMAIPFVFGNYVVSDVLNPANLLVAALAFVVGLGREIVKSVEDVEGDRKARRSKTLPVLIGSEKSLTVSGILYALFAILSVVPYYLYLDTGIGFGFVLVADAVFLYSSVALIFSRRKNQFLKISRNLSLFALFIGLMGILLSVLGY